MKFHNFSKRRDATKRRSFLTIMEPGVSEENKSVLCSHFIQRLLYKKSSINVKLWKNCWRVSCLITREKQGYFLSCVVFLSQCYLKEICAVIIYLGFLSDNNLRKFNITQSCPENASLSERFRFWGDCDITDADQSRITQPPICCTLGVISTKLQHLFQKRHIP